MTGYLQRLAAGAANSGGPIHPVTPPIFSDGGVDDGATHPPLEETTSRSAAVAPPQPHDAASAPRRRSIPAVSNEAPALVAAVAPNADVRSPSSLPAPPAAVRAPRDVMPRRDTLQGRDDPDETPAQDDEPPRDATADRARALRPPRPPLAAPDIEASASRDRGSRREDPYEHKHHDGHGDRPLLVERTFAPLLPASTDQTLRVAAAGPPVAAPRPDRAAPSAIAATRHAAEPHEVQIHIGRIEVTAVPPAPAPPPPVPPRRSAMSLADYLHRRNGRAT